MPNKRPSRSFQLILLANGEEIGDGGGRGRGTGTGSVGEECGIGTVCVFKGLMQS